MTDRDLVRQLLRHYAYSYREPAFKLKSGRESNHYIDCRPVVMHPLGGLAAGRLMLDVIEAHAASVDVIAGVVLGAVPLVDAIVASAYLRGKTYGKAYVRPELKDHGTQNYVELDFLSQVRRADRRLTAVLVDDVWTTGGSATRAQGRLANAGIDVIKTVVLVERREPDAVPPSRAVFSLGELVRTEAGEPWVARTEVGEPWV